MLRSPATMTSRRPPTPVRLSSGAFASRLASRTAWQKPPVAGIRPNDCVFNAIAGKATEQVTKKVRNYVEGRPNSYQSLPGPFIPA
jgi:hypothetical protein